MRSVESFVGGFLAAAIVVALIPSGGGNARKGSEGTRAAPNRSGEVEKNAANNHQCAAAFSLWRTELPIAFYVVGNAAVLRTSLAAGPVWIGGNRCIRAIGSHLAGRHVASQKLGVPRGRSPNFRQLCLCVRHRARASGAKRRLRPERSELVLHGQPFQSRRALVFRGFISDRLLHGIFTRTYPRAFRLNTSGRRNDALPEQPLGGGQELIPNAKAISIGNELRGN